MANFYTIIPRLGNKTASWKHIHDVLKEKAKKYYCEPFIGSGFVFLKMKKLFPQMYSMVGDMDNELGNYWWQSLTNTDEICKFLGSAPSSEGLFNYLKKLIPKNDMERAVRFWYLARLSGPSGDRGQSIFKCRKDGYSHDSIKHASVQTGIGGLVKNNKQGSNGLSKVAAVNVGGIIKQNKIHNRKDGGNHLSSVPTGYFDDFQSIMQLLKHRTSFLVEDYERLIQRADDLWGIDKYLLYCDPPYVGTEGYYGCEFDHERLFKILDGRDFVLNYNDCMEIRRKYKDYKMKSYEIRGRKELLIWKECANEYPIHKEVKQRKLW